MDITLLIVGAVLLGILFVGIRWTYYRSYVSSRRSRSRGMDFGDLFDFWNFD